MRVIYVVVLGSSSESLVSGGLLFKWMISRLTNYKPHLRKYSILHRSFFESEREFYHQHGCLVVSTWILQVFDLFVVMCEIQASR